jgi:hypothetical protein
VNERKVDFTRWLDPVTPVDRDEPDDEFDDDQEWDFVRNKFAGEKRRATPYRGYIGWSNTHGFYPLGSHNLASRTSKLWVAHANFRVTQADKQTVEDTEGVEVLQVTTPYRFIVGVGFQFDSEIVKEHIRFRLCPPPPPPPPPTDFLVRGLQAGHPAWALVGYPDGKRDCATGQTRAEVEAKLAGKGGVVRQTSWEKQ